MRLLVLLLFLCSVALAQVPGNPQQPEVQSEQMANGFRMMVNNPLYAPISVLFTLSGDNFSVREGSSFTKVFPARARTLAFSAQPANSQAAWNLSFNWTWKMGDLNAQQDNSVYDLPFAAGVSFQLNQGYGGKFSHNTPEGRFALDFNMPEGTPIHAAREGVVVALEVSYTAGGLDPALTARANAITLLHSDGTFAEYIHLRQGGSVVQIGQRVSRGQLIGYSGNTGYSSEPHLHFHVYKTTSPSSSWQTIPVLFNTREGRALSLKEGQRYTRP